jgi:hypothetical protein
MKKGLILAGIFAVLLMVVGVVAEDKISLEVTIKSVKGDVEVKSRGGEWEKAAAGAVLKEGAQISTGFGAEAELVMANNSVVVVSQLTQIKIDKFFKEKTAVKTDLGLKIGKIRAKVQRVGQELSDFKVVTPTSVVSVRGTGMDVLETDRGTNVRSLEHIVVVRDTLGRPEVVRPNQESNVRPGEVPTSVVTEMQDRAKVDTATVGLTREEVVERHDADIPEVKPGEPGKSGSVS